MKPFLRVLAVASLLALLATFPAVHGLAAAQDRYQEVPIYGTLNVMRSTEFRGARGSMSASGSELESFQVTYSGFDERGKQIMTIRGRGAGEMTSKGINGAGHCRGKLSWDRTVHEDAVAEVNLAEQRYRFRPELFGPTGEVDCTVDQPRGPTVQLHETPEIDVPIPSNVDGEPVELSDPSGRLFHGSGPVYEEGTLAGAWNGTSASGGYDLHVHPRVAKSWVSQGAADVAGTLLGGPESITHTMVYWHLSLKPIEPCIAKITFASGGDIKVDGEPAYETIAVEGQPRIAFRKDVQEGQTIVTGVRTRVELTLADGSSIRIGPESTVNLGSVLCGKPEDRKVSMKLVIGNIWAKLAHSIGGDAQFEVRTSNAACGVRDSEMEVSADANHLVILRIDEGHGHFRGGRGPSKKEVKLEAGFCSSVRPGEPPSAPYRCEPFFIWEE